MGNYMSFFMGNHIITKFFDAWVFQRLHQGVKADVKPAWSEAKGLGESALWGRWRKSTSGTAGENSPC